MDLIVHHYLGAKDIVKEDVIELIGKKKIQSFDKFSIIKKVNVKDISILSFLLQSAIRVGIFISKAKYKESIDSGFKELEKKFDKKTVELFLNDANSFAIETIKDGNNEIATPKLSAQIGDWFSNIISKKLDVNLRLPQMPIFSLITEDEIILSIDVIGFSLAKRPYKIALHAGSINGVLAHTISRLSGVKKTNLVVDPFCGGGTIPIEVSSYKQGISAFPFENKFTGFRIPLLKKEFEETSKEILNKTPSKEVTVYGFDNMLKVMKGAQRNAKLSGVFESIKFSKVDIEWIDSKFEEGEVDIIITNPPQVSNRNGNKKQILKIYDDLFYQGRYILNKKGTLNILLIHDENIEEIATKHQFKKIKSTPIQSGGQAYSLIQFKHK